MADRNEMGTFRLGLLVADPRGRIVKYLGPVDVVNPRPCAPGRTHVRLYAALRLTSVSLDEVSLLNVSLLNEHPRWATAPWLTGSVSNRYNVDELDSIPPAGGDITLTFPGGYTARAALGQVDARMNEPLCWLVIPPSGCCGEDPRGARLPRRSLECGYGPAT